MDDVARQDALGLIYREGLNTGRVSPALVLSLHPESHLRRVFMLAQDQGLLDGQGYVTPEAFAAFGLLPGERQDTQSFPYE